MNKIKHHLLNYVLYITSNLCSATTLPGLQIDSATLKCIITLTGSIILTKLYLIQNALIDTYFENNSDEDEY